MPKKETKTTSTAIATATPKTDYEMVMNQFFNIDFSAMNKVIDKNLFNNILHGVKLHLMNKFLSIVLLQK